MTVAVEDADRALLSFEEDNSVGNSIQFRAGESAVDVTIDNPWSGDTETGFGRTAYISISRPDAARLAEFLANWIDN